MEFEAIISPTYPKEGGLLVQQLRESGVNAKLYGGDNWGAPEFRNIAGSAAEGVFFTFPSESQSSQWSNFVENYKIKHNDEPDIFAAYAYDAATAIFEAMKSSKKLSGSEIRSQLLLLDFEGLTGRISFKENGDIDNEGYGKRTIDKGKLVTINQKGK
jgi:branched-chain amino acid transport system substrate-binding protein